MQAVMLSVRPRWCELIASGRKTIEVRKTYPNLETPFTVYIYQSKSPWIFTVLLRQMGMNDLADRLIRGKGKVIGEFVCNAIDTYPCDKDFWAKDGMMYYISTEAGLKTCLTYTEIEQYGNGKTLYGWHISDLVIYDTPLDISKFSGTCESHLKRPPQSWCYVNRKEKT